MREQQTEGTAEITKGSFLQNENSGGFAVLFILF